MLLMIDNYDSFTYNLVQYLGELGEEVRVVRNDELTVAEIARLGADRIVLSPGPCSPNEAGVCLELIAKLKGTVPILGVCLGHQAIGQAFGGKVVHAKTLMHGKVSRIHHEGRGVFAGLPTPYEATRYHSLAIERASCPAELEITAWTEDGEIMGVRHRSLALEGVQFHPESILTQHGHALLKNFLARQAHPGALDMFTPHEAINRLSDKREIFYDEMVDLMRQVMEGKVSPVQLSAILMGLHVKTESVSEIAAAASVMREFSTKVDAAGLDRLVDTCGTGGDKAHTFNISTTAAFVAAAAGARVAKHGGRAVSSQSGSADLLESLGVNLALTPEQVALTLREVGLGFMFAPNHHPAMKHAAPVRRELGMRTILNILGPLTNPAAAPNQVMGVFHLDLVGIQARVLKMLGSKHVLTVHGADGLDEITLSGPTHVAELKHDFITEYTVEPKQFGFDLAPIEAIQVKDAADSRARVEAVLANEKGPSRDIVILNAAAALYVAGVAASLWDGVALAREAVESGGARRKLDQLVKFTQAFKPGA